MSDLALEMGVSKILRHKGSKWILYSHDGSKTLGEFDTEEVALKRERQINYFKHVAKSDLEAEFEKSNTCHVPSGSKGGQFCSTGGRIGGAPSRQIAAHAVFEAMKDQKPHSLSYLENIAKGAGIPSDKFPKAPVQWLQSNGPKLGPSGELGWKISVAGGFYRLKIISDAKASKPSTNVPKIPKVEIARTRVEDFKPLSSAELRSQTQIAWKNLNFKQKDSLEWYTGSGHFGINKQLRKYAGRVAEIRPLPVREATLRLDAASKVYTAPSNIVLYRGSKDFRFALGEVFVDHGFVSTSVRKSVADAFVYPGSTLLKILVPKGARVIPINGKGKNPSEAEVLLPRRSKFKVVGLGTVRLV